MKERGREAILSHQVRSKVCIFDAELGLSILVRRRALEMVTMTTRHSTTALTCRQRKKNINMASSKHETCLCRCSHTEEGEFTLFLKLQDLPSKQHSADLHYFICHCSMSAWSGRTEQEARHHEVCCLGGWEWIRAQQCFTHICAEKDIQYVPSQSSHINKSNQL